MIEVEGTFAGRFGFIVAVLKVEGDIPVAELDESTGFAIFPLAYQAVVFRPFKGEVLDSVVTKVTEHGFFAECGPLTVFVSHYSIPADMAYKYEESNEPMWKGSEPEDDIRKNTSVRLRIIGLKIEATEISATATIQDPYLGRLD
ncbi:unnamed protein product [Agarophyton chilense]